MPKNVNSESMKKKQIKSSFMIYAGFENSLLPEENGKQNRG